MQVRCQNCGAHFIAPTGISRDLKCPRCHADIETAARASRRSAAVLKRVFEPIPRPVVYLAGAALALLLTSPFWIYISRDRSDAPPVIPDDDATNLVVPAARTNAPNSTPLLNEELAGVTLNRFHDVQLDGGREELQRRFNLRLQNSRGMVPEIYEAQRIGDIEQFVAYFYGNALKEFSMTLRQRQEPPDVIQRELVEQFGEPKSAAEVENTTKPLGLPGIDAGQNLTAVKFPKRRNLTWHDAHNVVEASIVHNGTDSVLNVRLSAAAWLRANHQVANPSAPASTNAFEQIVMPGLLTK